MGSGDSSARGGPQHIPRPDDWRPGAPAPWAALATAERHLDLAGMRTALAGRGEGRVIGRPRADNRRSAVLVPLYEHDGELHVILTRRAAHLRSHRWEVSFPGGGEEADDASLWATAVREAHEEIGLDPDLPAAIGELDRFVTVGSGSLIHPYVAALPEMPRLRPDPSEVEHIRHVPVSELLDDEVYREERWVFPGGREARPLTFFELHGDTVWGATGAMLRQLLSIGLGLDDGLAYDRDPLGRDPVPEADR